MSVVGAKVKQEVKPFLKLICKIGEKTVMHDFLYLPECPMILLGCYLLHKLGPQINFENEKFQLKVNFSKAIAWQLQIHLLQTETENREA